jgi:hypothetical protein
MDIAQVEAEPLTETGAADEWLTAGRFALLLALLLVATFPGVLFGGSTFIFRDFGMFSYPVAHFQRQCFWRGELPLWNPFNNCGLPFLAQWNTLALYPFSLIYLLLPLTWSLSFFCLAHLFWGGLGMYFLAHRWTNHRLAAGLAGVIFSFNGLSLNFLMWPSHVATFSWLPWVVWLGQRAWREGGRALVWGTAAGAMQMLAGGPETIVLTWLILSVLACGDWIQEKELRTKLVSRFLGMGILVGLVCAVQLLPFLELLAHSQRDRDYGASTHDWCMPFWGWANFLVPLFRTSPTAQGVFLQNGQYWTSSYYAGIGTVFLAAVAVWRVRDWRVRAMAGLVLLGSVLALGDSTLLYQSLRLCFPGLGLVRYPVKFVILVLALAPLLAAFGIAALAGKPRQKAEPGDTIGMRPSPSAVVPARLAPGRAGRFEVVAVLLMLLLVGAIVALDCRSSLPEDAWRATWQSGLSRAVLLVLAFLFAAALLASGGHRRVLFGCLLLLLFWLDFVTHAPTQNPGAKPSVYAPGWARAQLNLNPAQKLGGARVMISPEALEFLKYNPTANLEETYLRNRLAIRVNCNLLDEVPQIDGFFSLVPREISRVTGLPYDHPTRALSGLLDFLGVSQTTAPGKTFDWAPRPSAMPLVTTGQQPVFADERTAFDALSQTNLDLRHIVFLPLEAREAISASRQTTARVLAATFASHQVSIQTEAIAASLVVISQTYYPAWKASVDGQPARIWRANYSFQALEVPAGRHQIVLLYEDRMLLAGAVLTGLGLLSCTGLWVLGGSRTIRGYRRSGRQHILEFTSLQQEAAGGTGCFRGD